MNRLLSICLVLIALMVGIAPSQSQCDALFRKLHYDQALWDVTDSNYEVVVPNGDLVFMDSSGTYYNREIYRFGDGDSVEFINPSYRTGIGHHYLTSGVYVAEREVWGNSGCHALYKDTFHLFVVRAQAIQRINNGKIYLYNTAENFDTCWWKFFNSTISTDVNPVISSSASKGGAVRLYIRYKGIQKDYYLKLVDDYDAKFSEVTITGADSTERAFAASFQSWPYERWNFGDGFADYVYDNASGYPTSYVNLIKHSFPSTGKYTVTRYIADSSNGLVQDSFSLVVDMDYKPCYSKFIAVQDNPFDNTLRVDNYSSEEFNNQYFWTVNNGTPIGSKSSRNLTFKYSGKDTFQLCLQVKNNGVCDQKYCDSIGLKWPGLTTQSTTWVNVDDPKPCDAQFEALTKKGTSSSAEIFLESKSTSATSWKWTVTSTSGTSFINGWQPTDPYAELSATQGDSLSICLVISNVQCTDSICEDRYVDTTNYCYAYYTIHQDTVPSQTIRLANHSSNLSSHTYLWDFENWYSTSRNPQRFMPMNKKYTVCLTVSDSVKKCTDRFCDSMGLDSNGYLYKAQGFYIVVEEFDSASLGIPLEATYSPFKISPNPVTDVLTIHLNSNEKATTAWMILDQKGAVIRKSGEWNEAVLDVSDLTSGIYTLIVQHAGNRYPIRFIKE